MAEFPPTYMGSTSEKFADKLDSFIQSMGGGTLRASDPKKLKKEKKKAGKKGKQSGEEEDGAAARPDTPSEFLKLMQLKYMRCLMQPGEAVGVLAAQSIGEPSTQMTLNTFHMAGRGEANVTMGIPRVREILMTAAKTIKTPVMVLPVVKSGKAEKNVQELASRLRRIRLAELMQSFKVLEYPVAAQGGNLGRAYVIEMTFVDPKRYPADAAVTFQQIEDTIQESFVKLMNLAIKAALRKAGKTSVGVESEYKESASGKGGKGAAATEEAPGGVEADDDDAEEEENENQDGEEYEEGKLRWRSGRNELATYDDDDDSSGSEDDEEKPAGAVVPVEASKLASKSKKGGEKDSQLQLEAESKAKDCKCSVTIRVPLDAPKLMMLDIAERVAARTFVRATSGIEKCYMIGADQPAGPAVQTDGINFIGAFQQADLVDINRITCNCVTSMLTTFGVEAARATIVQEVRAVFGAYGIGVDMRHLSLIADYMTQGGGYRAMSRTGISSCTSPLLKMSFETAAKFLTAATLEGDHDDLRSPSSRIIVGRVMGMGTGCMDLMHNLS